MLEDGPNTSEVGIVKRIHAKTAFYDVMTTSSFFTAKENLLVVCVMQLESKFAPRQQAIIFAQRASEILKFSFQQWQWKGIKSKFK